MRGLRGRCGGTVDALLRAARERITAHVAPDRASRGDSDASVAAENVLRLAVLLHAGLTPMRCWEQMAAAGDSMARGVLDRVSEGAPLDRAIALDGGVWRDVGAAWTVATTVGAPLADALRSLAVALRDGQQAEDDVRVALAEPTGTARLIGWLPLVGLALGALLGFDTLGSLCTHPVGIGCLLGGAGLIVASRVWTTRLVRRARDDSGMPGLDAELVAIGLSGGASIERARRIVESASGRRLGRDLDATLELSTAAGVPAVELLRASAELDRHRARVAGRLRAAALSSRLLLPLGACTLPAFLLLGVAPMLLSVLSSTSLSM